MLPFILFFVIPYRKSIIFAERGENGYSGRRISKTMQTGRLQGEI